MAVGGVGGRFSGFEGELSRVLMGCRGDGAGLLAQTGILMLWVRAIGGMAG